jgi:hypothetical protein
MTTLSDEVRCIYRFPSGRRCRQSVSPDNSQFCLTHLRRVSQVAAQPEHPPAIDGALADEITELAGDFSSPGQVNRVMGKIFHSLLHRRISAKEAGVLCYIAQTILHSHRTLSYLEKAAAQATAAKPKTRVFINDLPTAIRD